MVILSILILSLFNPALASSDFQNLQDFAHPDAERGFMTLFGKNPDGTVRDPRKPMLNGEFPWVGKLKSPLGGCTGSLVGPDLVLTNAHCVVDAGTGVRAQPRDLRFFPSFVKGQGTLSSVVSEFWVGTTNLHQRLLGGEPHKDWALLRLRSPLGKRFGYAEVQAAEKRNYPRSVALVGYAFDFQQGQTAGIDWDCKLDGQLPTSDLWLHDCASSRGASGGPLLMRREGEQPRIVALNSHAASVANGVSYHWSIANKAVNVNQFQGKLKELLGQRGRATHRYLHVCNREAGRRYRVAVAWRQDESVDWSTRGWLFLYPGNCEELEFPGADAARVMVHVNDLETLEAREGARALCVREFENFELAQASECPAEEDFVMKGFNEVPPLEAGELNELDL